MRLPLAVWTTGRPVPGAERARGSFFDMIRHAVGDAWTGHWHDWDCVEGTEFPEPHEVAGVIITGSPARLGAREPWMLRIEEALVPFVRSHVPVLGICFGHQLLGSGLGGKVGPNPNGREIGTTEFDLHGEHEDDELLSDLDEPDSTVVMTHLDSVVELPPGAHRLGTTELEGHAAIRFSHRVWGVQFHPEMDAEILGHYLEDRRSDIEAEGLDVDAISGARVHSDHGKRLLRRFVEICHLAREEGT